MLAFSIPALLGLFELLGSTSASGSLGDGYINPLYSNLAYRSPFVDQPLLGREVDDIHELHIRTGKQVLRKRQASSQIVDADGFRDDSYPKFYGADFSNSPFIWSGGIKFTHSVASGDPFDTSVLLWTRAVPKAYASDPSAPVSSIPDQAVPVCVTYAVHKSSNLSGEPVVQGHAFTSYDVDFTVKVEAQGLKPDTWYWYAFSDCTNPSAKSPVGRTRTFASPDTPAERVNGGSPLTLAVFSCSAYPSGWFNAYGVGSHNTSADVFIHLGDYIYEKLGNGKSIGRQTLGRELATIGDYRQRLAQHRTDASLVAAHQNAPWITVWDDHEVADNAWKAGTTNSNDTASGCQFSSTAKGVCFSDRKLAAVRAYHEWMPIRQVDAYDKLRIWRDHSIGKLVDLVMLDTRHYDRDITNVVYLYTGWYLWIWLPVVKSMASYANRSLMGFEQENWLYDKLSKSKERGAIWRVIGQQIVFTQLNQSGSFGLDGWDGYRKNRARVLEHIQNNTINNVIVLAGDSHANWVSDLAFPGDTTHYNPSTGKGALGVEFAGTAVSSTSPFGVNVSPADANAKSSPLLASRGNEALQWSEGSYRGFFTLTLDSHWANATYYAMKNISYANLDGFVSAKFTVRAGENKLGRPVAGGHVSAGVLKANALNNGASTTSTGTGVSTRATSTRIVTSTSSSTRASTVTVRRSKLCSSDGDDTT